MTTSPRSYCSGLAGRESKSRSRPVRPRGEGPSGPRTDAGIALSGVGLLTVLGTRSCLLHRFVKNEWRVLSSQTIGVEFASKIIKVGTGARRKRIKLQVRGSPAALYLHTNRRSHSSGTRRAPNASAPSRGPTTAARPAPSSSTTSPRTRPLPRCSRSSTTRAPCPPRT